MTTLDDALTSGPPEPARGAANAGSSRWDRFEALLERAGEHLNPILVKEARQALRSKQFIATFMTMLTAGWIWSILGLALIGPGIYYSAEGPSMFWVYHLILAFPLMVVAPYAAFHSLSSERQDRTYELVSITALTARQILSGKLCGIMLQMMVYLSAIFPCLAFTYLLRGIDIFTILLVVLYTCAMSLGLSMIGLLFATLAPPRQRQIANAVVFAMLCFGGFFLNCSLMFALVQSEGAMIDSAEFWQVNLALATFFLNTFAIVFLAARSQLTTVCQNRSTHLRIALVVAELSLFGWFAWAQLRWGGNFVFGFIFCSTALWWFVGIFLTGESMVLSERVERDLPQSLIGRVFLTWFAPGPGTGYMFAVSNMLAVTVMACFPFAEVASSFRAAAGPTVVNTVNANGTVSTVTMGPTIATRAARAEVFTTSVLATSYVVIYLGIGKLLVWRISRFGEVRLTTRVLVHLMLLLAGSLGPWTVQLTMRDLRSAGYTLLQIYNPVWTVWECCNKGIPLVGPVLVLGVPAVALVVWLLNLPPVVEELKQVRIAKPPRVAEEDAELAAAASPGPASTSPWD